MYRWVVTLYRAFKTPEARGPLSAAVALLATGTVFYMLVEKWSLVDSFYFSVTTLTTVGFGQPAPDTDVGKIFTAFFVLSGVGMFLAVLNAIGIAAVKIPNEEVPIGRFRRGGAAPTEKQVKVDDLLGAEQMIAEAETEDDGDPEQRPD